MKEKYVAPCIKRKVTLHLEDGILAGSVVNKKTTIETAGQKVETKDFSDTGFNSTWE